MSYTAQTGEKGAPLHVLNNPPNPPNSYWRWPTWDIGNLYWFSITQFGANDDVTLKTRLFYNTYENSLYAYDDATYTTQSLNGRFQSFYDDLGYGGSVEVETPLGERNTFGAAFHYRRDEHTEFNDNRPTHPTLRSIEPCRKPRGHLVAGRREHVRRDDEARSRGGLSYEENDLKQAQEFNADSGPVRIPDGRQRRDQRAGRGVLALRHGRASCAAVVSSRTRFPTIFERFSTRFGTAIPNPDLEPERAVNYEVGWAAQLNEGSTSRPRCSTPTSKT